MPHEFNLGGVYLAPELIAIILGAILAVYAARLLNKYHLTKYFVNRSIVFLALAVIFSFLVEFLFLSF